MAEPRGAGESFRSVRPGEPLRIRADDWNAAMAAGRAQQTPSLCGIGAPVGNFFDAGMVLVSNSTESDWGVFEPKGLAGPYWPINHAYGVTIESIAPEALREVLVAEELDYTKHQGQWCVTLEPIAAGAVGRARVQGLTLCRVEAYTSGYDSEEQLGPRLRYVALVPTDPDDPTTTKARLSPVGDAAVIWRTLYQGGADDPRLALIDLGARQELALCRLATAIQWPNDENEADVPFATGVHLQWHSDAAGYADVTLLPPTITVWFPNVRRAGSDSVGMPHVAAGDIITVRFNQQSARWEAMLQQPAWCRFEMTDALTLGMSAMAKTIVYSPTGEKITDEPPAETITVHDVLERFSKMPTANGDDGVLGVAVWATDKSRWEILSMQTPADFWGVLAADLHNYDQQASVTKVTVLDGYDVFGTNHGDDLTVVNPAAGGNQAARIFAGREGDRVLCRWDMRAGQYYIVLVEPNDFDWQALDVVTRTTLTIDFDAKTFTHRYYTRQITIPPGVTIGDEVQH